MFVIVITVVAVLALSGCGGSGSSSANTNPTTGASASASTTSAASAATTQTTEAASTSAKGRGMCSLASADEVSKLTGMTITVADAKRDRLACQYEPSPYDDYVVRLYALGGTENINPHKPLYPQLARAYKGRYTPSPTIVKHSFVETDPTSGAPVEYILVGRDNYFEVSENISPALPPGALERLAQLFYQRLCSTSDPAFAFGPC